MTGFSEEINAEVRNREGTTQKAAEAAPSSLTARLHKEAFADS